MNHTCLYSPAAKHHHIHRCLAGTHCAYPRKDGQAELTWLHTETDPVHWKMNPDTVTHPNTNWAQCRLKFIDQNQCATTMPNLHTAKGACSNHLKYTTLRRLVLRWVTARRYRYYEGRQTHNCN